MELFIVVMIGYQSERSIGTSKVSNILSGTPHFGYVIIGNVLILGK